MIGHCGLKKQKQKLFCTTVDLSCSKLTVTSSQEPNLLRPNNLWGDSSWLCELVYVFLWINLILQCVPHCSGLGQLLFTNHAQWWTEVQDVGWQIFLSAYFDPMLPQEIFQTPFSNKNNKKKWKDPAGWWHTANTHITQTGSSKIFKPMVLVDYSYQSEQKYREPFFLLVQ